jgi:hypothetical protein
LFYERRIGSLAAVVKEAETMDADAGIRMSGRFAGRRCYVFVSKMGPRYTVMVYERKSGRRGGLGKRLASEEVESTERLRVFLRNIISRKVEAFVF